MEQVGEQLSINYDEQAMLIQMDISIEKDFNGSRRKYADEVSTSEALRKRRIKYLAQNNGHG